MGGNKGTVSPVFLPPPGAGKGRNNNRFNFKSRLLNKLQTPQKEPRENRRGL